MAGIGNSLYPPIMPTYQAAFIYTNACRVYFSLSPYNSYESISKNVQITVSYQNTNISALDSKKYPTGIMLKNVSKDKNIEGDNKYYIEISPTDIEGGFEPDTIYKVQVRFTENSVPMPPNNGKIASWLNVNQAYFSEWSTVCLIKSIYNIRFYLNGFEGANINDLVFTSELNTFIGGIEFGQYEGITWIDKSQNTQEELKSYRIKILKDNELYYDSGDCYSNDNSINHTVIKLLEDGSHYSLNIEYLTSNDYSDVKNYTFTIIQNTIEAINATINTETDIENGRIKVNIISNVSEVFFGNLIIRRSSSKTDYTIWEDVHQQTFSDGQILNYTWYDYTVESGIWYKYCVQKRNSNGDRGAIVSSKNPVMVELEDMFLTRAEMQFKIKFDPTVSSFKRTYLESRTETLGSKYPFIRRNGNVEYRQFPISGLITGFCDEEGLFLNKDNLYANAKENYAYYNSEKQINEYTDRIYEKQFRDKIMDFLYADNLKLFRSNTEGNILVRLMDINFTPNNSLGRMLYSFTATAYEMDECTLENFENYGIQTIGDYSTNLEYSYKKIGQVTGDFAAKEDIFITIAKKYSDMTLSKYINTLQNISWLRIEFNSDPYLIKTVGGVPMPLTALDRADEDTAYGYIVYINNKPIIVSPRRFYELIDEDTEVTSIYFPIATNATIDYMAELTQTENTSLLYNKMYFNTKVGQIHGLFDVNESVFKNIYLKYLLNYTSYHQSLMSLNEVTIEAEPGTVVYVKDSFDEDYFKHELGPTGVLRFYDEDATLIGFYFAGMQLYNLNSDTDEAKDNEFRLTNEIVTSLDEVKNPIKNGVYTVNNQRYIYYQEQWYKFSDDNVVQCPVYALVDYIYELMKGEY